MLFWILVLVALAGLTVLFFRLTESIIKGLFSALGIIMLIMVVLGLFAIMDARSLAKNMQESPTLYVLEENGRMLAGVKDISMPGDDVVTSLDDDEFAYYSALYEDKDYKSMLGNKYKLFIVDMEAFSALQAGDFDKVEGFDRDLVFSMLRSESAVDTFINRTVTDAGVDKDYQDMLREKLKKEMNASESGMRSNLFMMLLDLSMKKEGAMFIMDEYKRGNIEVYPETMLFKSIKIMPFAVLDSIGSFTEKGSD